MEATTSSPLRTATVRAEQPATPVVPAQRGRRGKALPEPTLYDHLSHLDLEQLRAYRRDLQGEESNVSYWRRIIQARLDMVQAGGHRAGTATLSAATLRPALTETRVRSGRTALIEVLPIDDIPPLPNLGELWERRVSVDDDVAHAALERDLSVAETQLSAYRTALHRRLGEATADLIARYREEPTLCLSVLPLEPPRRTR